MRISTTPMVINSGDGAVRRYGTALVSAAVPAEHWTATVTV